MPSTTEIVRACFKAYETKDRALIESLIAEDFTFTSPLDDAINRDSYFNRCWPNSEHLESFDIEKLFVEGNEAFVQYHARSIDGSSSRNTEFFTVRDGQLVKVVVYFGNDTRESATEDEVRSVIEAYAEAIRQKDADAMAKIIAPNAVSFSLAPPLQNKGFNHEELAAWFATFKSDIGYETPDQTLTTSGDLASSHSLHHMTGTKTDGEEVDLWFRVTIELQKIKERWLITHSHESVPFYMDGSFKAAVDLKE